MRAVEKHLRAGKTREVACALAGSHRKTLWDWENEPDGPTAGATLTRRIENAEQKGHGVWEGRLDALARKGNVAAVIFYLKARCGWKEIVQIKGALGINAGDGSPKLVLALDRAKLEQRIADARAADALITSTTPVPEDAVLIEGNGHGGNGHAQ